MYHISFSAHIHCDNVCYYERQTFKAKVNLYNKQHRVAGGEERPGSKLFLEVVKRLTVAEEDPVLGRVLRLKGEAATAH